MRFDTPQPVREIAQYIRARIVGNENGIATGINEIHRVEPGDIVFVDHPKYYSTCVNSAATVIIIDQETSFPEGKTLLVTSQPFEAYLSLVDRFRPFLPSSKLISDTAVIGKDTVVMPGSYVGHYVKVGSNCIIGPQVSILDYSVIGDNVIIQAGTVIGSDAFYYNRKTNRDIQYRKMNSCGRVVIGNGVEIGANCTIDRGVSSDTVIGDGTKLDNLVHVGHDTVIGKNCLFAAQVGIAGATTIEDEVILWGQVGVSKTLQIGKGAVVLAQSGVPYSIDGGNTYFGSPAIDAREKKKELVWIRRIPEIWAKINGRDRRGDQGI